MSEARRLMFEGKCSQLVAPRGHELDRKAGFALFIQVFPNRKPAFVLPATDFKEVGPDHTGVGSLVCLPFAQSV